MGRFGRSGRAVASAKDLLPYVTIGMCIGMFFGWILMDTYRVIFKEIGVANQYSGSGGRGGVSDSGAGGGKSSSAAKTTASTTKTRHTKGHHDSSHKPNSHGVHVLITAGSGTYQNFQVRIMYGTFKMVQKLPGGENMAGFTRILHSAKQDHLMDEIPTFMAKPLIPACDEWCDFPPAMRPDAVQQFFDAAEKDPTLIKGAWVFLGEPDYVWIKPLMPPAAESTAPPQGFPFGYIIPTYPTIHDVMTRLYPQGDLAEIPGTGPAPALMRVSEWRKVLPDWVRVTAQIEADPEAVEKLEWIREMYAFSVALAVQKIKFDLRLPPQNNIMVQPPADKGLGAAKIMHYTWGSIINNTGGEIWRFDKRDYYDNKYERLPPLIPDLPAYVKGLKLQDGVAVTQELRDTLSLMVRTMNAATQQLKPLKLGRRAGSSGGEQQEQTA